MSSEQNAPADDTPAEEAPTEEIPADVAPADEAPAKKAAAKKAPARKAAVKKAAVKKAAVKKAAVKKAPAKRASAKKAASKPVTDWLASWPKDAEPEDVEALQEQVQGILASRSDLLPSVRKIVEADIDLTVRVTALKLFVEADAGSSLRSPTAALEAAQK